MDDRQLALIIAEKAAEKGGTVYYVGGCVRDRLLGRECKDIDIEIHGLTSEETESILDSVGERLEYGKSFGIYSIRNSSIDIALPRGSKGTDPFAGTSEASRHRDLTINALMEKVLTGEITDHLGGVNDLKIGIIRHVDDDTFVEDPLRVFRAAQFAARFSFDIAEDTVSLCRNTDVSEIPPERIMSETEKALMKSERPSVYFESLRRMGKLDKWFPEAAALIGVPQNREFHLEGDAWTHTMLVLDEAAKRREKVKYPLGFMMSALCHDFGKPVCTTEENGVVHSYGHETEGLPVVQRFLERLTNEKKLTDYVLNMTELHMEPNIMARARSKMKKTNKLYDQATEPFDLIQLSICDGLGKLPQCSDTEEFLMQRYEKYKAIMARPYVMGRDLIEAGIEPCEEFAELLAYAHKLRLAGCDKENTLRQSIAYAGKVLKIGSDKK